MRRSKDDFQSQEDRIDAILAKYGLAAPGLGSAFFEATHPWMRDEEAEEEPAGMERFEGRMEGWRALLHFLLEDGCHPAAVVRRFFAMVKATAPHLINDMSMEDISVLCGDGGRATVSARIERIYNRKLAAVGDTSRAPCQKWQTDSYAAAQAGNKNRATGAKKKRILKSHEKKADSNRDA